mgnify:FL=1
MTTFTRPNILFINTDQQRWDTLGCTGCAVAKTPNLDRLAAEGVRFDACYTTNPVCMPARASFFTGQYPSHHGVWMNGVPLDPRSDLIQHRLKEAGYRTALIGKIHLDTIWQRRDPHPAYGFEVLHECEGDPFCFDEYFRWLDDQDLYEPYMERFKAMGHNRGYTRDLPEEKHMNNWIADHVEAYLDERAREEEPFFLSVGFFDPHHPFDTVEPYASMFRPEDMPDPKRAEGEADTMPPTARARLNPHCDDRDAMRRTIAAYHASIAHVDAMTGRILDALNRAGLAENTVIVFTSDHGEMLGDHGLLHKGPLFYEPAVRVPMIWRLPDSIRRPAVDTGFVSHVDIVPTMAALAGIDPPPFTQGRPLFDAEGTLRPTPAREAALVEWRERKYGEEGPFQVARCLVTDAYKYVYRHGEPYGELYDRQADPDEFENLHDRPEYAQTVKEMKARLLAFVLDNEPTPARRDIF